MVVFDFVSVWPLKQTEREVIEREWRCHACVGRWVTLSLPLSQQNSFSARRSCQFVQEPWNRFTALASGVTEGRWFKRAAADG